MCVRRIPEKGIRVIDWHILRMIVNKKIRSRTSPIQIKRPHTV